MSSRPVAAIPAETLVVETGFASDTGGRAENQDAVTVTALAPVRGALPVPVTDQTFLLAVADGMGGHPHGDVASKLAVEVLAERINSAIGDDAALALKQAFRAANDAVYSRSLELGTPGMGTTLTAAILRGKYATIASVGDSRAYLVRANALTQVTKDHSLVAEQVESGELDAANARKNPRRNILTQAVGSRERLDTRLPGIYELTLLPGDRLLLCSDGFYDVLTDRDYTAILTANPPGAAAAQLVALANERGATDNVSAVVAEATPTRIPTVVVPTGQPARGSLNVVYVIIIAILLIMVIAAVVLSTSGMLR